MTHDSASIRFALGVPAHAYALPHPRINVRVILIVRRALLRAFEMLENNAFPLATANEDDITNALHAILEDNLRKNGTVPGFNRQSFDPVTRHGPVMNYNLTRLIHRLGREA